MSIHEAINAFNNFCYNSPVLSPLRDSKLGIPLVQTLHLMGITMVLGTTVVMNMRLLGVGYRELQADNFLPQVWRWFRRGLILTLAAGVIVFIPDPVRYVQNTSFRVKMATLAIAILYQFTIFRKVVFTGDATRSTRIVLVCLASLLLWFGVGWCGRAIAFFG